MPQSIFTPKRTPSSDPHEPLNPAAVAEANETLRAAYAELEADPTLAALRLSLGIQHYHWSLFCEVCSGLGVVLDGCDCPICQGEGLVAYVPPVRTHDSVSLGSTHGQDAAEAFAGLSRN